MALQDELNRLRKVKAGSAVLFDGAASVITIADNAQYSIEGTASKGLSCSLWIRPDVLTFPTEEGTGGDRYVGIITKEGLNQNEWELRMYGGDNSVGRENRISFYVFALAGGLGDGVAFQETVIAGQWMHVGFTAQDVGGGITGIRIYKNGVNKDAFSSSLTLADGTAPVRIGAAASNSNSLTSYFKGAIKDVRFWNVRLSDTQMKAVYESTAFPTASLTGEFKLNEGSGTTATDTGTLANNGTITSGSYVTSVLGGGNAPYTDEQCLNVLAGRTLMDLSGQEAANKWAGTTGRSIQDVLNYKAGTVGLDKTDAARRITTP